ncbi:MAG TPA: hypothetical protein VF230_11250 [Acidimicrobiales bacterium]
MADHQVPTDGDTSQPIEPQPDPGEPASYPADDTAALPPGADSGATRALAGLLKLSPFLDLHDRAGTSEDHRFRAWVCFVLDGIVRFVVVALLLGVIVALAWKTLAPLPDFWQDGS